jgi:hypothetical protein
MKREDFYIQEATKYSQSETLNAEALAFIAGMKMADSYPNWIKAEDRLPEEDGQLCAIVTRGVIKCILLARWDSRQRLFSCLEKEIGYYKGGLSHWMPIVLPKED